jgi:hypothetical protein
MPDHLQILTGDCRLVLPTSMASKTIQKSACHPLFIAQRNILIREGEIRQSYDLAVKVWHFPRTSDLRPMFPRIRLEQSKRDNNFSLLAFNPKKWQQGFQYFFSQSIRDLPAIKRASIIGVWLLSVVNAAERIGQKFNSWFIDHAHLNPGMIGGRLSASLCRFLFLNSNVTFAIYQAGEISNVEFIHSEVTLLQNRGDFKYGV